ncbi:ribosomal RNA small subunit methyltransferase B [Brucella melitensis]|nr:ribosomal RNA small subunit methyltransferase B [Brucella melitensis]
MPIFVRPRGKTAQLVLQGADVTALDLSENRLKRLNANLERLGFEAKTVATNLMDLSPTNCSTPCFWMRPARPPARCASPGRAMDQDAAGHCKTRRTSGQAFGARSHAGETRRRDRLSNCSLHPLEGEEMARKAPENPLLEPFPITEQDCPGLEGLVTAEGFLRSTPADLPPDRLDGNPHMAGMDGFFAARFKRV